MTEELLFPHEHDRGDHHNMQDWEHEASDEAWEELRAEFALEKSGFERTTKEYTGPDGKVVPKGKGVITSRDGRPVVYSLPALAHHFPELSDAAHLLMDRWE